MEDMIDNAALALPAFGYPLAHLYADFATLNAVVFNIRQYRCCKP